MGPHGPCGPEGPVGPTGPSGSDACGSFSEATIAPARSPVTSDTNVVPFNTEGTHSDDITFVSNASGGIFTVTKGGRYNINAFVKILSRNDISNLYLAVEVNGTASVPLAGLQISGQPDSAFSAYVNGSGIVEIPDNTMVFLTIRNLSQPISIGYIDVENNQQPSAYISLVRVGNLPS